MGSNTILSKEGDIKIKIVWIGKVRVRSEQQRDEIYHTVRGGRHQNHCVWRGQSKVVTKEMQ